MNAMSDRVWTRILRHAGDEFHLVRGRPFTYQARGRTIHLDTTNRMISRTAIERALERVPLTATTDVSDLSAPSYVYALLTDTRIKGNDW